MIRILLSFCFSTMLGLFVCRISIAEEKGGPAAARKLTIAVIQAPGFAYPDARGTYQGITIEYIKELKRRSNLPLEIDVMPGARARSSFIEGLMPYGAFIEDKRMEAHGKQLVHLGSISQVALTTKDKPVLSFEELQTLTLVGVVRAGVPWGPLLEDPAIKRFEVNDVEVGLKMLMNRRIDALVGSKIGIIRVVLNHKLDDSLTWTKVGMQGYALYAQNNAIEWRESKLMTAISEKMVSEGYLAAILDRVLGPIWRD